MTSYRIVRALYASSAEPNDLRLHYGARCVASRLQLFLDEERSPNGDRLFSRGRRATDKYPLFVTIHAGTPTKVTLLAATPLDD